MIFNVNMFDLGISLSHVDTWQVIFKHRHRHRTYERKQKFQSSKFSDLHFEHCYKHLDNKNYSSGIEDLKLKYKCLKIMLSPRSSICTEDFLAEYINEPGKINSFNIIKLFEIMMTIDKFRDERISQYIDVYKKTMVQIITLYKNEKIDSFSNNMGGDRMNKQEINTFQDVKSDDQDDC
ncbi:hypothetical protein SSS_00322 [Sarcoptes scabiei]|uniref:Uncharacterized protein n=1 Tax=Sarcoptes scabiei TaxID=52283 RepID=A0A834RDI0_SARSC|nr:hypothetical protein SSS_00322 [Sarcoptes scabiei]